MRRLVSILAVTLALAPAAVAQHFTAEDALDIASYSVADVTPDGRWIAMTLTTRREGFGADFSRDGDPSYQRATPVGVFILDATSGDRQPVFPGKRAVRGMRWSPDGTRLALLVWNGTTYEPAVFTRAARRLATLRMPAGRYVAENSDIRWSGDGQSIVLATRPVEWRQTTQTLFRAMTEGPVFVQDSREPFLSWDAIRRRANHRGVTAIDTRTGAARELLPDRLVSSYNLTDDGQALTYAEDVTRKTDYDVIGGTEQRLLVRTLADTASRVLLPSTRGVTVVWTEDGRRYAYAREGRVYVASLSDTSRTQVAGPAETPRGQPADTSREARDRAARERFSVTRFSRDGSALLVTNREGFHVVDIASGARVLAARTDDSSATGSRVSFAGWSDDGAHLYFTTASRAAWERGIARFDRPTRQLVQLVRDGRNYSGMRLAADGASMILSIAAGNRPPDLYAADAALTAPRRIVESNPQLAGRTFGGTELTTYLDADGHRKHMVLYHPVGYQKDRAYPTVFIVYEEFFDDGWDPVANILAARGYLVAKPSVDFETGYPGEAWAKGVTAAANKLIEAGIADSARLGIHGTSYGGYATNLLITQTNRFKAAINISGKVDIISFYTDSPRIGVRNIHAAEKSQDRIGATLWEQPQKYVQHSAVMFADRIRTPLLLITGQLDSNVPADNTREMYYALRRLGKEVVWVNYMKGGHGGGNATAEEFLDMTRRIVEFYDAKLAKGTPTATP